MKVRRGDAAHCAHELLEPRLVGVQRFEDGFAGVLHLVLRPAGLQRFAQIGPESKQPVTAHLENASDVTRKILVQKLRGGRGVAITRRYAVAVALKEPERNQRVEKIPDAARMQRQSATELFTCHRPVAQFSKHFELDRGQQNLGGPEAEADFHQVRNVAGRVAHDDAHR
nr:hypothetical protein [Steroidobacter agaridevorans]